MLGISEMSEWKPQFENHQPSADGMQTYLMRLRDAVLSSKKPNEPFQDKLFSQNSGKKLVTEDFLFVPTRSSTSEDIVMIHPE